jgi:hypothetical protein
MYSPEMMDINKRKSVDNPISSEEFKKLPMASTMILNNGGMFCSSIISTLIKDYKFTDSFYKEMYMHPSLQNEKDFYGLSLNIMFEDTSKILMTLFVSSFNVAKKYIVHSGSQKFNLIHQQKVETITLKNSNNPLNLHKYQVILPFQQVQFIGLMLKVYDESGNKLVFDCFLEKYINENNIKHSFKVYRKIIQRVLDKKLLVDAGSEKVDDQRKEVQIAASKLLVLIGKKPVQEQVVVEDKSDNSIYIWISVLCSFGFIAFIFWYCGIMKLLENEIKINEELKDELEQTTHQSS